MKIKDLAIFRDQIARTRGPKSCVWCFRNFWAYQNPPKANIGIVFFGGVGWGWVGWTAALLLTHERVRQFWGAWQDLMQAKLPLDSEGPWQQPGRAPLGVSLESALRLSRGSNGAKLIWTSDY